MAKPAPTKTSASALWIVPRRLTCTLSRGPYFGPSLSRPGSPAHGSLDPRRIRPNTLKVRFAFPQIPHRYPRAPAETILLLLLRTLPFVLEESRPVAVRPPLQRKTTLQTVSAILGLPSQPSARVPFTRGWPGSC